MTTYIIRRLLQGFIVLIFVTLFIFTVIHMLPGDPIRLYLAESELQVLQPEQLEALRHTLGLDVPLPMQYINWIGGIVQGDFGTSMYFHEDISHVLAQRIPISIHLGLIALLLSTIGILLGTVCAVKRGTWIDNVLTLLANLGITAPSFWVGILFIYFFALQLGLLPVCGYTSPFEDFWLSTRQVLMPVFCLALFPIAAVTRQTRSSVLEVIRLDYIRTAWAKGLSERIVVMRHTLKNALIPVVTVIGARIRHIVGGAVIIETVFNIPGLGRMLTEAIFNRDFQVVQSGVLVGAILVLIANLAVDISYGWFDPRIRYTKEM